MIDFAERRVDRVGVGDKSVEPVEAVDLGVATVRARTTRLSQIVTLVAVVVPPLAILSAAGLLWGVAFGPLDLELFVAFYVLTGLGITVGYHRLFAHRSFEATHSLRVALAILGAMTLQGPVTQWVTDHRKHHARSDADGDPHSPHLSGDGIVGAIRGLLHSHIGWLFSTKGMERGDPYGRDLFEDRAIRRVDQLYIVWVALSVTLPFFIAYAATASAGRGFEALIWAGLIRIFVFEHATFSVNSICHTFGFRTYDAKDESTNNWVVAFLTFGEGWHNNHHAFPRSARHGLGRFQVDVSFAVIRALERLHFARSLRLPTPVQIARIPRLRSE